MTTPSRISDRACARAAELARQGVPQRQIAARLRAEGLADVSQATVSRAIKAAGGGAVRRHGGRPRADKTIVGGRPTPQQRPPSPAPATAATAHDLVAELRAKVGSSPHEALQTILNRRLPDLDRIADRALAAENLPLATAALRLEVEIAERLIAATPPPPADPETDPANALARDILIGRLEGMVVLPDIGHIDASLCPACRSSSARSATNQQGEQP